MAWKRHHTLTRRDTLLSHLPAVRPVRYADYVEQGGYRGLANAKALGCAQTLSTLRQSGLLGRGGAGFPTWKKWEMVMQRQSRAKYVVCNVAEDEPGTFKDRYLLRDNPHQLIEGILIAAHTVGAAKAYLYINKNFDGEIQIVQQALQEALEAGHWDQSGQQSGQKEGQDRIHLEIARSPGTYVAGEETAVLEVIEGRVAAPRQKPPYYPAAVGLYGMPTIVNNAETLANLPNILREGTDWFQAVGSKSAPGTLIFTLTGDVNRPGLYELPIGTPLNTLIETYGGGIRDGKRLKAVFPGGPSNAILPAQQADLPLDFSTLKTAGSGLGTGAVIVMSEEACMVQVAIQYARFFARESCGQCPPCVLGLAHLSEIMEQIEAGQGSEKEVRQVEQVCQMVKGRGYCYLLTGAAIAVESIFRHFRHEFDAHVQHAGCPQKWGTIPARGTTPAGDAIPTVERGMNESPKNAVFLSSV